MDTLKVRNLRLSELSSDTIEKIRSYQWDGIIEKHEGPETWDAVLKYHHPDFMEIDGYSVLLPINRDHHPNVSILRLIVGDDGRVLILFLKDTTFVHEPEYERFYSGRVAICEKVRDEDFYLATLYHEWFIIENP